MSNTDQLFRDELRSWFAEHPPPHFEIATSRVEADTLREWQRTLSADRWVGIHWPIEYGGRAASLREVAIYNEECARVAMPPLLGRAGISLVGPTLMAHGSDDQRAQWMQRILRGDDVWCQLFSEPDAGSDLVGLSTHAERVGDVYRVNGQKVWSSYATYADMGIALVRTDALAPPHKGISMLAIPMHAPGVEIRPLRQITGDLEFNEVFFDNVEVPTANLIGAEHDGWRVANTTLANERGASFIWKEQVLLEVAIADLRRECAEHGASHDPRVRQAFTKSWIDVQLLRMHNQRTLDRLTRGEEIGSESSIVKLFWATVSQRLYATAIGILGPDALLDTNSSGTAAHGRWARGLLMTRANSIMGGSSEIQHNIIAERILGLPREPK